MPVYEYRCEECGESCEILVRGPTTIACPHCGSA
ncbi:MAG: zinc ribbon domain-containing protein, partial [Anaerolineae bacterium]